MGTFQSCLPSFISPFRNVITQKVVIFGDVDNNITGKVPDVLYDYLFCIVFSEKISLDY